MSDRRCPFCDPDPDQVFFETELVVGLWDRYPVSSDSAILQALASLSARFSSSRCR